MAEAPEIRQVVKIAGLEITLVHRGYAIREDDQRLHVPPEGADHWLVNFKVEGPDRRFNPGEALIIQFEVAALLRSLREARSLLSSPPGGSRTSSRIDMGAPAGELVVVSDPEKGNWLEWLFYSHRVKDTGGNSRHPAILNALEVQQVINLLETAVERGALV